MSEPDYTDPDLKVEHILTQTSSDEGNSQAQEDTVNGVQGEKGKSDVQRRRKIVIIMGIGTLAIVVGVLLTVYFVLSNGGSSSSTGSSLVVGDDSNIIDDSPPTTGGSLPIPTMSPVDVPLPVPDPTVAPVSQPTNAPLPDPTLPPVTAPTVAPVPDPTLPPVTAPSVVPVVDPTLPPVAAPSVVPVVDPTLPPVSPPSVVPVVDPTLPPVAVPSVVPVADPTLPPVAAPSAVPVAGPTLPPVAAPTVAPVPDPTVAPTVPPVQETAPPVSETVAFINLVVEEAVWDKETLNDPTSPQYLARQWMTTVDNEIWSSQKDTNIVRQRFGLTVMDISLGGRVRVATLDTCTWVGVTCEEILDPDTSTTKQLVVSLDWARTGLTGTLPAEVVLLRRNLWRMDLAENEITGPIPETLYMLSELTHVYLHNNKMTGTLSEGGLVFMPQLVEVFLGHNELTGTIPSTWASIQQGANSKPLRYLVLHHNKFSGTIPTKLNWDRMFYMDLGNNQFTGSIPADIEGWWDLRHLYLNSNKLSGSLPDTFGGGEGDAVGGGAGNGRLIELDVSDNQLTGVFPGDWGAMRTLVYMDIKDNDFSGIDKDLCKMEVLDSGEIVELHADCDVCPCEFCGFFC